MNEQTEKALKVLPKGWEIKVQTILDKKGIVIPTHSIKKVVVEASNHKNKLEVLEAFAEYTREVVVAQKVIEETLTTALAELAEV